MTDDGCPLCSSPYPHEHVISEPLPPGDNPTYEELAEFKAEWDSKDGNTPGYNLQKARTYGDLGHTYKRLFEAYKAAAEEASEYLLIEAQSLEGELMRRWSPPYGPGPVAEMAGEQAKLMKIEKDYPDLWGRTPLDELTTEQLQEEINRRTDSGPYNYTDVRVSLVVTARRPSGHLVVLQDWQQVPVDIDSFCMTTGSGRITLEATKVEK